MGSFRERSMAFAPARAEAFQRAQEPDRFIASPATTRGILFLLRRRARGQTGRATPPHAVTSSSHRILV